MIVYAWVRQHTLTSPRNAPAEEASSATRAQARVCSLALVLLDVFPAETPLRSDRRSPLARGRVTWESTCDQSTLANGLIDPSSIAHRQDAPWRQCVAMIE